MTVAELYEHLRAKKYFYPVGNRAVFPHVKEIAKLLNINLNIDKNNCQRFDYTLFASDSNRLPLVGTDKINEMQASFDNGWYIVCSTELKKQCSGITSFGSIKERTFWNIASRSYQTLYDYTYTLNGIKRYSCFTNRGAAENYDSYLEDWSWTPEEREPALQYPAVQYSLYTNAVYACHHADMKGRKKEWWVGKLATPEPEKTEQKAPAVEPIPPTVRELSGKIRRQSKDRLIARAVRELGLI